MKNEIERLLNNAKTTDEFAGMVEVLNLFGYRLHIEDGFWYVTGGRDE